MTGDRVAEIRGRLESATISGFPGYEVHSDGSVWATGTNWRGYGQRRLTPVKSADGYLKVRLHDESGKRRNIKIHKAVAEAFLGDRPSTKHQVRHRSGNKFDNRSENLEWGTAKQNADDREGHGTTAIGSRNGWAKLTEQDVVSIQEMLNSGATQRGIAATFGVTQKTIWTISKGKGWRHVC